MKWFSNLMANTPEVSMKRFLSLGGFVVAAAYTFVHPGEPKADPVTLGLWTGLSTSMMIAAAVTKT